MLFPVIEAERIKHKLDRQAFADLLGVSIRTVCNWQGGRTEIPLSKLIKMTEIWGVSADYLLNLDTHSSSGSEETNPL